MPQCDCRQAKKITVLKTVEMCCRAP